MADYYPPVGFHFAVYIEGFTDEGENRFQEVSGLSVTVQTESHYEGGETRFAHQLPTRLNYGELVLKRGTLVGSSLIKWCKESIDLFEFYPQNILVVLLNAEHQPLMAWNVVNAYPTGWSVDNLDAQQNRLLVESLHFKYQYFDLLTSGINERVKALKKQTVET